MSITGSQFLNTQNISNTNTNQQQYDSLDIRLQTAEHDIDSLETADAIQDGLISGLNTRVGAVEAVNLVQTGAIDSLTLRVGATETINTTQAGQISGLNIRVGDVETVNTTQAGQITSLTGRVGGAETVNSIQAGHLSSLSTRMTAAEGVNNTQNTDITNLTTRMTSAEGVNNTQNMAISGLDTRVGSTETINVTQDSRLTTLEQKTFEIAYHSPSDTTIIYNRLQVRTLIKSGVSSAPQLAVLNDSVDVENQVVLQLMAGIEAGMWSSLAREGDNLFLSRFYNVGAADAYLGGVVFTTHATSLRGFRVSFNPAVPSQIIGDLTLTGRLTAPTITLGSTDLGTTLTNLQSQITTNGNTLGSDLNCNGHDLTNGGDLFFTNSTINNMTTETLEMVSTDGNSTFDMSLSNAGVLNLTVSKPGTTTSMVLNTRLWSGGVKPLTINHHSIDLDDRYISHLNTEYGTFTTKNTISASTTVWTKIAPNSSNGSLLTTHLDNGILFKRDGIYNIKISWSHDSPQGNSGGHTLHELVLATSDVLAFESNPPLSRILDWDFHGVCNADTGFVNTDEAIPILVDDNGNYKFQYRTKTLPGSNNIRYNRWCLNLTAEIRAPNHTIFLMMRAGQYWSTKDHRYVVTLLSTV